MPISEQGFELHQHHGPIAMPSVIAARSRGSVRRAPDALPSAAFAGAQAPDQFRRGLEAGTSPNREVDREIAFPVWCDGVSLWKSIPRAQARDVQSDSEKADDQRSRSPVADDRIRNLAARFGS